MNPFCLVTSPPRAVTPTLLGPTLFAGVVAVMLEDDTTTTFVAAMAPTVTLVAPVKLVPVIVILVPPATGPDAGLTFVMVGGAR